MRWAAAAAVIVLGAGALWAHDRIETRRDAFPADVDVLYVPQPQYLAPMSVGYREALADLIWIRALIFSGAHIGGNDLESIGRYVDAVSGLAPKFERVYRWGGVTAIYGGSPTVTRAMVDQSIAIYRRGLQHHPESHQLLYALGMILTHQVGSTPGYTEQEREALAEEGVEYIKRAAAYGADPLVRQYAATLVADRSAGPLAVQFLQRELAQADDEDYRRMLRKRLSELGGTQSVARVETIRDDFAAELTAQAPYVPDGVYAVIRDERSGTAAPAARRDDDGRRPR